MRILVHDFGGYAFPVQLSRELARRGHTVQHAFCGSLHTTPHGGLEPRADDPPSLRIHPITLPSPLAKYSFLKRWVQENQYGRLAAAELVRFHPDVVLSANTPLDSQRWLMRASKKQNIHFIFWLQDLIGIASEAILRKKIPIVGGLIGSYYLNLERSLLRGSDRIIVITDRFGPILEQWGISRKQMHVIENWAPLDEMPVRPKVNPWSQAQRLDDKFCLFYAGTLGMKHNPELILALARHFRSRPDVCVVVVSQGQGADMLRRHKEAENLNGLRILGYQPFEQLPDVLGTADLLLAVLEPEASRFSVPSKVLTYLCAGRPLLLAVPEDNLAARVVLNSESGFVTSPSEPRAFIEAAELLVNDPVRRKDLAERGRAFAEQNFDIGRIADAFEHILQQL